MLFLIIILAISHLSHIPKPYSCVQRCLKALVIRACEFGLETLKKNGLVVSSTARKNVDYRRAPTITSMKINDAIFPQFENSKRRDLKTVPSQSALYIYMEKEEDQAILQNEILKHSS